MVKASNLTIIRRYGPDVEAQIKALLTLLRASNSEQEALKLNHARQKFERDPDEGGIHDEHVT